MDIFDHADRFLVILRDDSPEAGQGVNPHRQVVIVLAITVGRLADPKPPRPSPNTLNFRDHPFGFIQKLTSVQLAIEREQQHHTECIGP